jgi:Protein of unknown function (DUF3710)
MAFGKRKSRGDEHAADVTDTADEDQQELDGAEGPFDIEDFDSAAVAKLGRHDLGGVLIPENDTAELAVEVNPEGVATTVWMVTPNGRYNITAYAAPKAGGLWREVVTELADSLRNDEARVSIEDGIWGREVVGLVTKGPEPVAMRFVGVDGYRWMVRGAAISTPDNADAIAVEMRNALADTVVRRGDAPQPVRAQLPLQLSDSLVARLRARAEQMTAEYEAQQRQAQHQHVPAQQQTQPAPQQQPPAQQHLPPRLAPEQQPQPVARRSEQGSAMQQLRTITGG